MWKIKCIFWHFWCLPSFNPTSMRQNVASKRAVLVPYAQGACCLSVSAHPDTLEIPCHPVSRLSVTTMRSAAMTSPVNCCSASIRAKTLVVLMLTVRSHSMSQCVLVLPGTPVTHTYLVEPRMLNVIIDSGFL